MPSRSDDPVPQPTTAADALADLQALLAARRRAWSLRPCRIYGVMVARLYASTYQADVSGLLLVDALSEGLQDAEMPEQWVVQRSLIEGDIRKSLVLYPSLERWTPDQASPGFLPPHCYEPMPLGSGASARERRNEGGKQPLLPIIPFAIGR